MNALKSMCLDLRTSKVYGKNLILILIMIAVFAFTGSLTTVLMMIFFMTIPLLQYPFVTYEKCGMLYHSLPQKKSDIVLGRYILAAAAIVAAAVVSAVIAVIVKPSIFKGGTFLLLIAGAACMVSLMYSVQAPVFFKFGYTKSRIFAVVSIMIVAFAIGATIPLILNHGGSEMLTGAVNGNLAFSTAAVISALLFLAAAAFMVASYFISRGIFAKKDL